MAINDNENPAAPNGDLMGWRKIARHLGISEKTARNWERERGLPVHRFDDSEKSPVWANIDELKTWKSNRGNTSSLQSSQSLKNKPESADSVPSRLAITTPPAQTLSRPLGGHFVHAVTICVLYALLYVASMLLEITYQFDLLGSTAMKLAPVLFLWILGTSLLGLTIQWKMVLRHRGSGLALSLATFAAAALAQHVALTFFLPTTPVTEAAFQTLPAQAAHLKNTFSFLQLPALFMVPTYHFVLTVQAAMAENGHAFVLTSIKNSKWYYSKRLTSDALYVRREWLILGIFIASGLFIASSWHVFDKLKPNPYLNAFSQLFLFRDWLWVGLAAMCLFWYNHRINLAVQECEETLRQHPQSAAPP